MSLIQTGNWRIDFTLEGSINNREPVCALLPILRGTLIRDVLFLDWRFQSFLYCNSYFSYLTFTEPGLDVSEHPGW